MGKSQSWHFIVDTRDKNDTGAAPLVAGGILSGLGLTGVGIALAASAKAAPPPVIPKPEVPTPPEEQTMAIEKELAKLNKTFTELLTIQKLEYNFDQTRYLASKVRAGEAVINKGAAYELVASGATATVLLSNPVGYVLVLHYLSVRVSQNAVFELTLTLDNALVPWLYIPRFVSTELHISQVIPYDFVVKETTLISYTNFDPLPQWGATTFIGTHVRKDIWERDIGIMNNMAQRFSITSPFPTEGGGS